MNKLYEQMVFSVERYHWQNSLEEARSLMWQDIGTFLQLLAKNEYLAVVYDDATDIIVVQYEHNERIDAWGCANPVWMTSDEAELFDTFKDNCVEN